MGKKSRRPNRRNRKNRHNQPSRLKMAIVTSPSSSNGRVNLSADVELVKAAILYADDVELVSLGAAMLGGVGQVAEGGPDILMELFRALDDDTMRYLAGGGLPDNWRQMFDLMANPATRAMMRRAGMANAIDEFEAKLRESSREMRSVSDKLMRDSGADELVRAIDEGILSLSSAGLEVGGDIDATFDAWRGHLEALLRDRTARLVFDESISSLVSAMVREGMVELSHLTRTHAKEGAAGAGFVARLSAFPEAPLDELIDLRTDLIDPLTRYRAAATRISQALPALESGDTEYVLDDLWRTEIGPALVDIREGLVQHGLVREVAARAGQDAKVLLVSGAGLYWGLDTMTNVEQWVTGIIAAAGPAAQATVAGAVTSAKERRAIRQQELFYLYEVNNRIS